MRELLVPRRGRAWKDQARAAIHTLEQRRAIIRPVGAGLDHPGCHEPSRLDLVTLRFDFADRALITVVRVQRPAAIALLKALRDEPLGITVGYGGTGATASYRSCALQEELRRRYEAGIGGWVVEPGFSWHNRGLAVDAPHTEAGKAAMLRHGWFDIGPSDPSHFSYGVRG